MRLKKLTLHNFGVYAGTNTFVFQGTKPVVLIGGMNGRGKTTFLEAILLSLYSSNSFAYTEGKFSSYGQYLKSFVNKSDGTYQTFLELEFDLSDSETYLIHRGWNGNTTRIREDIYVQVNGEYNAFLTENWPMFMENILPSGLSNFFFFDGEKIAALAEEDTNEQMKESIRTLLGINVIDRLEADLKRISKKAEKESEHKYEIEESNRLREIKEEAERKLDEIDSKISELESSISEIEKQIEVEKNNYTSRGGDIVEKKQELFHERSTVTAKIQTINEQMNDAAASALPLILTRDLLKKIEIQVKSERLAKENELTIKKINELYNAYSHDIQSNEVKDFMKYIESNMRVKSVEELFNLSEMSYLQVCSLNDNLLNDLKKNTSKLIDDKSKLQEKLDEIDSYLSVEIDEKAINKIYKKILELEKEKVKLEVEKNDLVDRRPSANGDVIRFTAEFTKYVESMLSSFELDDDNDRLMKYTHKVSEVLETYKYKLQERKVDLLAQTMTSCYKKLANKKTLINYIKMDAKTLDFYYYNGSNETVPKNRLSAGEKQLMVVALLWSLAICSKRKLPIIIDTPLSRLDSKHRVAFIKTYFPNASDQTIILSTDSEIFGEYYEILKKNVGDEFTLCYDDESKCTTIEKGYKMENTKW